MKFIKKHNAEAEKGLHTFTVAVNQYADLTNGEFTKNMGGLKDHRQHRARENNAYENNITSIPSSIDWREKVHFGLVLYGVYDILAIFF